MTRCKGEYNKVYAMSQQKSLLRAAQRTPIDRSATIHLLRVLAWTYGITLTDIRFLGAKALGSLEAWTAWEGSKILLVFPRRVLSKTAREVEGCLRVGLVLHEFAHALIHSQRTKVPHGRDFIGALDMLLVQTAGLWANR